MQLTGYSSTTDVPRGDTPEADPHICAAATRSGVLARCRPLQHYWELPKLAEPAKHNGHSWGPRLRYSTCSVGHQGRSELTQFVLVLYIPSTTGHYGCWPFMNPCRCCHSENRERSCATDNVFLSVVRGCLLLISWSRSLALCTECQA